jgi:NADH-quinone oxidoreductase subunit M
MNYLCTHTLSSILAILALAGIFISIFNFDEIKARYTSLIASLMVLAITIKQYLYMFDPIHKNLQMVESYKWIGPINFSLGVDGLAYSMVLLMAILLPCAVIASKPIAQKQKPRLYYALLMFLALAVMAVFMAKDIFLFFLAWELELVPMYLLIAIWGSKNRNYASMKFMLYTFAAGILLLIGLFVLLMNTGFQTFDMVELAQASMNLKFEIQSLIFILVALCFIIKLPSVPLHTWLPDAHVEAPTPVSMLLAGILLKMGCYGLVRFGLGFFPAVLVKLAPAIAILAVVNIIYGAYAALVQTDLKKIVAYSSISHMGFILLGLAALNPAGYSGAVFQMFSHGLISAALFMIVGMLYERTHTRDIGKYGGLAKVMPQTFFISLIAIMANLGLPGLSGFVGESLVFYGAFSSLNLSAGYDYVRISAAIATLGVIITAGYMLWMNQRVFYGETPNQWLKLKDARRDELLVLAVLIGLSLLYGIYPKIISDIFEPQLVANAKSISSLFIIK